MGQIRTIKKRMVAVRTIQRITRTMQMIATARFTAALQRAKASRPYTDRIRALSGQLAAAAGDFTHPLTRPEPEGRKRERFLVISSDRGLCGAYNGNVLKTALQTIRRSKDAGKDIVLETKDLIIGFADGETISVPCAVPVLPTGVLRGDGTLVHLR